MEQSKLEIELKKIAERRVQILDDYIRAWTAANVEDHQLNPVWFLNNVELEETRSPILPDGTARVTYRMVFKKK